MTDKKIAEIDRIKRVVRAEDGTVAEYDRLLGLAAKETDATKRFGYFQQAEARLVSQAPVLPDTLDALDALQMLRNAEVAAKGVLPFCQDTGTATVVAKKGQQIWTGVKDEEWLSKGIYKTYTEENLRYSQTVALDMYEEINTGTNLPAQIDIMATDGAEVSASTRHTCRPDSASASARPVAMGTKRLPPKNASRSGSAMSLPMSSRSARSFCRMMKNCRELPNTAERMRDCLNRAYCCTMEMFQQLNLRSCAYDSWTISWPPGMSRKRATSSYTFRLRTARGSVMMCLRAWLVIRKPAADLSSLALSGM